MEKIKKKQGLHEEAKQHEAMKSELKIKGKSEPRSEKDTFQSINFRITLKVNSLSIITLGVLALPSISLIP